MFISAVCYRSKILDHTFGVVSRGKAERQVLSAVPKPAIAGNAGGLTDANLSLPKTHTAQCDRPFHHLGLCRHPFSAVMNSTHFRQRNYLPTAPCLSESPTPMLSGRGLPPSVAKAGRRPERSPAARALRGPLWFQRVLASARVSGGSDGDSIEEELDGIWCPQGDFSHIYTLGWLAAAWIDDSPGRGSSRVRQIAEKTNRVDD